MLYYLIFLFPPFIDLDTINKINPATVAGNIQDLKVDQNELLNVRQIITTKIPVEDVDIGYIEKFRETFVFFCLEEELIDRRETFYMFCDNRDFLNSLLTVQNRYERLKDVPKIGDIRIYIPLSEIKDKLANNRRYINYLKLKCHLYPDAESRINEIIVENERVNAIYDLLNDVKAEYYYITSRRCALSNLKEKLGDENYYKGIMPEYITSYLFIEE